MTTTYPRLPELAPRQPDETAEHYGLRAFNFVVATNVTATLSDDALQLAAHVYRLAIARPDLMQATIDRFADCDRAINATIRRRAVVDTPAKPVKVKPAGVDKSDIGPMAPLLPSPIIRPPAPSFAHAGPAVTPRLQRDDIDF